MSKLKRLSEKYSETIQKRRENFKESDTPGTEIGGVLKRIKKWMLGENFKELLSPIEVKDLILVAKTLKDIADGNPPDAKESIKRIGLALIGH